MLFDIGKRALWFFLGAVITLFILAWRIGGTPAVLEKKQNDAIIAACEQELPRNKHCVLIAVREDDIQ